MATSLAATMPVLAQIAPATTAAAPAASASAAARPADAQQLDTVVITANKRREKQRDVAGR